MLQEIFKKCATKTCSNMKSTVVFRILNEGLQGNIIQTQELPLVISTVSSGFAGYLFVWDFIQQNWDCLIQK